MPAREYRLRIATAGATTVAGNVEFTYLDPYLREAAIVGGQSVDVLACRAASKPWTVELLDVGEQITADMADSGGRFGWNRRLADYSEQIDGGGFTVLATARIIDVDQFVRPDQGIGYRVSLSDERAIERGSTIFTAADTTCLYPHGVRREYGGKPFRPFFAQGARLEKVIVKGVSGSIVTLQYANTRTEQETRAREEVADILRDDLAADPTADDPMGLSPTEGNFQYLRWREVGTVTGTLEPDGTGTDHEVIGFFFRLPLVWFFRPGVQSLERDPDGVQNIGRFKVVWNGTVPSVDDVITGYFYMPNRPPDELLPLHLGQSQIDGEERYRVQIGDVWKDVYDGTWGGQGPKYESAAFSAYNASTNPHGLIDHPELPLVEFRITRTWNMAEFVDALAAATGVIPFVNEAGEVAPRRVLLPATDQVPSVIALTDLTDANVGPNPPTWTLLGRQLATVIEAKYQKITRYYRTKLQEETINPFNPIVVQRRVVNELAFDPNVGFDMIMAEPSVRERLHDNVATLGRWVHTIDFPWVNVTQSYLYGLGRDYLDRFGEGPQLSEVEGLSGLHGVVAGQWVTIQNSTYPDMETGTRGGTRLVQVISKSRSVEHAKLSIIDAGADNQPLAAPTVAVIKNAANPKQAIDVTVSNVPSGARVRLSVSTGATEPAESSPKWRPIGAGFQAGTFTYAPLPVGKLIWVRGRSIQKGRVGSDWSTAVSAQLDFFDGPPTGLDATNITATEADLTWNEGDPEFGVEIQLDGNVIDVVNAGVDYYQLRNLTPNTTYNSPGAQVRHIDQFGIRSAPSTKTFSTTVATFAAPVLSLISATVQGASKYVIVTLYLLQFDSQAETQVQRAPDDTGSPGTPDVANVEDIGFSPLAAGTRKCQDLALRSGYTNGSAIWHYRARHVLPGETPGSWSNWLAVPTDPFSIP